ncbi:MAG: glycine/betaine/sarcosine/D-proline family reductase selenoprotein B [Chloroflexi bacterium]|nr:glycine/betaine/sarcosine/D-proline family reductase selenoprotein B [Chloroflexota bacterium]
MGDNVKAVHYLNQFFAGIGGEEKADTPLQVREGAVGPGTGLEKAAAGKLRVLRTIICGDNYFHSHTEEVINAILKAVRDAAPDVLVAGPAFNSGRYGLACRAVGERVSLETGIPAVTAVYKDSPALDAKPIWTYVLPCGDSVLGMGAALAALSDFARKLATGARIGDAESEGFFPRGIRRNVTQPQTASLRAIALLKARLKGELKTEIPLPVYDRVAPPAPIPDLSKATIALVTDGGLVIQGNPGHLESARATKWFKYSLTGIDNLTAPDYECIHGGFDIAAVNKDPDRVVPLDAVREMEKEGKINKLHEYFYTTTGNVTPVASCKRLGQEMAAAIKAAGVDGVVLTGT